MRVYSRPGCHLCEQLVEELLPLLRGKLDLEVVDVDSRPDWQEKYSSKIPVLEWDAEAVCHYTLDVPAVRRILAKLNPS